MIMPYNGSMFQLIGKYKEIIGDELNKEQYQVAGNKYFKIKYTLNILPIIGAGDHDFYCGGEHDPTAEDQVAIKEDLSNAGT